MIINNTRFMIITAFLLAFIVILFNSSAMAVSSSNCEGLLMSLESYVGRTKGYARVKDLKAYESAQNILFLSDGTGKSVFSDSIARDLAVKYPQKLIFSTGHSVDLEIETPNNLLNMYLDNTEPFPFLDNKFDAVVLKQGLCMCNDGRCCGGFGPTSEEVVNFFYEVARVLNKDNLNAKAFLHGNTSFVKESRPDRKDVQSSWKYVFEEIEKKHPVLAKFIYFNGKFIGIEISVKDID